MVLKPDTKTHKDAAMIDNDLDIKPYKIYSKQTAGKEHDIYLSDSVEADSSEYIDLLRYLNSISHEDQVTIHLANFGGAVHTGIRVAHAMKNCAGTVIVNVDAPCYSMGAILATSGDILLMNPGTFLMFHNYSTVEAGKAGELKTAVLQYEKHFHYSLKYFCSPFLSKTELAKLSRDEDVYIHYNDKDLARRCKRHFPMVKSMEIEQYD